MVSWPAVPVVAAAYVDQLERAGSLPAAQIAQLRAAIARPNAGQLRSVAGALREPTDSIAAKRVAALRRTLLAMSGNRQQIQPVVASR